MRIREAERTEGNLGQIEIMTKTMKREKRKLAMKTRPVGALSPTK